MNDTKGTTVDNNKDKRFMQNVLGACVFALIVTVASCGVYYFTSGKDNKIANIIGNNKYQFEATKVSSGNLDVKEDVSDIIDDVMPSVVSITEKKISTVYDYWFGFGSGQQQESTGSGSGILIEEDDDNYYIATNNHVIDGADKIEVTFIDNKVVKATTKGTDASNDLAIIAVAKKDVSDKTKKEIKIANMGDSDKLRVGEQVIAIGNALGYGQSVTSGYVSAKDRELEFDNGTMTAIQTDAAINPGNSGGALINIKGEVIGISSAKLASQEVEGMGYAIPISKASPILDKLIKKEKVSEKDKGYLGITIREISKEEKEILSYPDGVYVNSVGKDGGAAAAGMKPGDIITKVDGDKVKSTDALLNKIAEYKIGETIKIEVKRNNKGEFKEVELNVTLTKQVIEQTPEPNKFN